MNRDVTSRLLFVLLLLAMAWSALQIVAPFIAGLTWAAVLVVTFRPFHRRLVGALGSRQWAATAVVTLLVAAFVVVPVTVAAVQAVRGGVAVYDALHAYYNGTSTVPSLTERWPWLNDVVEQGKRLVGLADVDLRAAAVAGLQKVGSFLAAAGPALVGGAIGFAFSFIVMIIGIPLLFAHGEAMAEALAAALPIPLADARSLLQDIGDMTRSVFMSVGLTAAAQALLAGIGFAIVGVPRVASLSALTFFLALLPGGVALVWAPVALLLAAGGHTWSAGFMVLWGGGVVGTSDNVLRPVLAGRGVKLDGGTLFLGMVGGMIAFGIVGLFIGPIVLYVLRELVRILRRDVYAEPADAV